MTAAAAAGIAASLLKVESFIMLPATNVALVYCKILYYDSY